MRFRGWIAIAALIVVAVYLLVFWPLRDPHPSPLATHGTLAIRDAKIYPSPDAAPLEHATIVMRDGVIAAVGPNVAIPNGAELVPCDRCIVTAGFWNSHVHFTQPKWDFAAFKPAAELNAQLADMLTSRGFTTVVDTGSDPRQTISLRRRIESGDLLGPRIYTATSPLYPPHAVPYYIRDTTPFFMLWLMPQPETPAAAVRDDERDIGMGADILKLFTGSWIQRGKVLPMPVDIARAAVEVAHAHGQLAFSHPSNLAGTKVAIESGVDVLAHAPDDTRGVDDALIQSMVAHRMAMIPTLKMFATTVSTKPSYLDPIYAVVRRFHESGGELMFGTDVGYMADYATEDEFRALAQSGLNWRDMLRMLTVAPAQRFKVADQKGTIEPGKLADLVVLDRDPSDDVTAFAQPRATIRSGRVIYARPR